MWGPRVCGKLLYLLLNFATNLTLLKKSQSVGKNPPPHLSQLQFTCQTWPFLALILLEASEKYTFSTVFMLINQ